MKLTTAPEMQAQRTERAMAEYDAYSFVLKQAAGIVHVAVTKRATGDTHIVTPEACSCRDFEHRCHGRGLRCKHQELVDLWLGGGPEAFQAPQPAPVSERRRQVRAQMAHDFAE